MICAVIFWFQRHAGASPAAYFFNNYIRRSLSRMSMKTVGTLALVEQE